MISGTFRKKSDEANLKWEAWKADPTPQKRTEVVSYLNPTIKSAMHSFGGDDPSLKVRARILASEALDNYDPKKGASLQTHVYNHMRRLSRYRAQRNFSLHVPENVRFDALAVKNFEKEYEDENGSPPSMDELVDRLKMSRKRIQKARMSSGERLSSSQLSEKGDDTFIRRRSQLDIWADYVYHDLDPKSKKVFEWSTGYGGSSVIPKIEIARRLNISPAAVSGRLSTINKKLHEINK